MMTESERLKAARKALELSERAMAAALGMRGKNAKDDLRKMEEGMRPVTGPVLVAAELMVAASVLIDVGSHDDGYREEWDAAVAMVPEVCR